MNTRPIGDHSSETLSHPIDINSKTNVLVFGEYNFTVIISDRLMISFGAREIGKKC
jgi:hypothetical protein